MAIYYVTHPSDKRRRQRKYQSYKAAVAAIGRIAKRDPRGVSRGEYSIDGPCRK